jgi:hypothetical protein
MGANPQPQEVGPIYDLLLQTRDGQPLTVLNADRMPVQLAGVAYMTTIDRQQQQHEETELQHKDQVVQLASPNLIDRELDQWPQISQGDWSGGGLQRVLTGSTPLTSFQAASDPTRYWDGLGLLFPLTDYVPQQPLVPSPVVEYVNTPTDSVSFAVGLADEPFGEGFRFVIQDVTQSKFFLVTYSNGVRSVSDISAMPPPNDMVTGGGTTWLVAQGSLWHFDAGTLTSFDTFPAGFNFTRTGNLAVTVVGNRTYVAVAGTDTNNTDTVRLYDVTNFTANTFTNTAVTPLQIDNHGTIRQVLFSGSNLIMVAKYGPEFYILQYAIVGATWTTLAKLPGYFAVRVVDVGGTLFITCSSEDGGGNLAISLFMMQGNTLQDIGPLTPPTGLYPGELMSLPAAAPPYAIFGFYAQDQVSSFGGNSFRVLYAYDVEKGKLFHFATLPTVEPNPIGSDPSGSLVRLAVYRGAQRQFQGQLSIVDLAVVLPLSINPIPIGGQFTNLPMAQELLFGVTQTGLFGPKARGPLQIISSLIDFTSDQGKLFRQGVVKLLTPMAVHPSCAVQLDVWLDQDPDTITTQPDFSAFLDGTGKLVTNGVVTQVAPGGKRLVLPIDVLATKLVYRLTTYGGVIVQNGSILSAPKPKSVAIRVATGWVQTLLLDIAPQVQSNGKNVADVWTYQGIDSTAAYNFIRMLWRKRGGECLATFPNGDSGDWLLQDAHFDTPKPMGTPFRADQRSTLKYVILVKLREDIL